MGNVIYYNSQQDYGNDCIIYKEIYIIKTLKDDYMVIQMINYASNWALDTPNISYDCFYSEDTAFSYAHELEKEW